MPPPTDWSRSRYLMARRPEAKLQRPAARLYLVTPREKDPSALARALDEMLAAADVAAVLLRLPAGGHPPFAELVERVAWWAELFELPCVGCAASLDEVGALAAAGADFVALGDFVFSDSRGPSAMIRAAAERLSAPEPVK